ncbi:MAG: CTP synthase [Pseudomonadota bacterium]|nr:CTP synthase [Pseudomonadota bacterium]
MFVTGGVVSSLGKGIVAASAAALLEARGLRVTLIKADPYINVDPGTMSPQQHGEVYVTSDGAETDLDLGHYERFTSAKMRKENSFSTGQIYDRVINNERRGDYLGGTVQVVPQITDAIKDYIYRPSTDVDVSIVEIGGTVGDIESLPFLEAVRQIRSQLGSRQVLFIHMTLVPYLHAAQELKTKPTQHSVKNLRQIGIQPDILICRAERELPPRILQKVSITCDVRAEAVIQAQNMDSIYKLPLHLHSQGLDKVIVESLKLGSREPDLRGWQQITSNLDATTSECEVAIVGKYVNVIDSYKSVSEALIHAGIKHRTKVNIHYVDAEQLEIQDPAAVLGKFHGIVVPGGFGERGIDGKIKAITYCRTNNLPFFGICYGMQLAVIEFARSVLGLSHANSAEFGESNNQEHVITHLPNQTNTALNKGGTMRLGSLACQLLDGSKVKRIYGKGVINERHRHRLVFNNAYREQFRQQGMVCSGLTDDLEFVEVLELQDHRWFICCQYHPELQSSPRLPHPLFSSFVEEVDGGGV